MSGSGTGGTVAEAPKAAQDPAPLPSGVVGSISQPWRGPLRAFVALALVAATTTTTFGTPATAGHRFPDVNDASSLAPAAAWALDQQILTGYPDGTLPGQPSPSPGARWSTGSGTRRATPPPPAPTPTPTSGRARIADDAATWAAEQGIVGGYPNHTFRPGLSVTRGQVVSWLWRLADQPTAGHAEPLPRRPPGSGLADAVAWSAEHGIAGGYPDGRFKPSRTRHPGHVRPVALSGGDPAVGSAPERPDDPDRRPDAGVAGRDAPGRRPYRWPGTTFTQSISAFPLCCPARATHATGQYSHNHGVVDNDNEPHPASRRAGARPRRLRPASTTPTPWPPGWTPPDTRRPTWARP